MQKRKVKNNHLKHMSPEKMKKKTDLKNIKPTTNLREKPEKNIPLKIAREKDPLYKSNPVFKRSRRQKPFQASNDMDTDYVTDLASEEY
ncbi:hypothetical protein TNIN_60961 [Trichonephila inaurata madagascariensis]|uniref:Uncharacterized protein n=1 Tax=Trichonephila inaurata madagascariensis TaxID=2747483 RepID=A0A8X7CNU8_9ARAC|nr:hypothetical protein TNIN_60961 [Trichonephila inaurata madagascariensis]